MKKLFALSCLPACLLLVLASSALADNWPAWRGDPAGSGVTPERSVPLKWDEDTNVRWRVSLPEPGNSTPVVWGDRIFVTQAVTADHWRGLMCFNQSDGTLMWKNGVRYAKEERTHRANFYCSASPATDGERVVAAYGSAGVVCYDMAGKEIWSRDFGPIDHVWGNSTSPVLHKHLVIYYHGPGKGSFLAALDKATGKTVWKFEEPDWDPGQRTDGFRGREDRGVIGSFSTPIIVKANGRDELVMSFPMEVRAFDPTTGKELWRCRGLNPLVYTSPVYADGMVIAMGGYQGNSLAVRVGGTGDVTDDARLWHEIRHNGGIGTGVVKGDHYYYHNSGGVAFCMNIETGEELWKARLPGIGKSWGSFLLAGDRIYSLSQGGEMAVFQADPSGLKILAHNKLGEKTNSSPVVSNGDLFIRTHEALWCITAPAAN